MNANALHLEDVSPELVSLVGGLAARDGFVVFAALTSEETEGNGWSVSFFVERHGGGWRSLELLAWIVTDARRGGDELLLLPVSPPPDPARPGESLYFMLRGRVDPDELAARIDWLARTVRR